jgi:hypothetical protein
MDGNSQSITQTQFKLSDLNLDNHKLFGYFAKNGFQRDLVPIIPLNSKMNPFTKIKEGGKTPGWPSQNGWGGLKNWSEYVASNEEIQYIDDIAESFATQSAGVGLKTERIPFIDVDIDGDADLVRNIFQLAVKLLGKSSVRKRKDSTRIGIPYRLADWDIFTKCVIDFGQSGKVELLGKGQQFVAIGNHKSGNAYEWFPDLGHGKLVYEQLPEVSSESLMQFWTECCELAMSRGHEQRMVKKKIPSTSSRSNGSTEETQTILVPKSKNVVKLILDQNSFEGQQRIAEYKRLMVFNTCEFGTVTIEDMIDGIKNEPDLWNGVRMQHPEEPEYAGGQPDIAMLFKNEDNWIIHSHAHSGTCYIITFETPIDFTEYFQDFHTRAIRRRPNILVSHTDMFLRMLNIPRNDSNIIRVGEALYNLKYMEIEGSYELFEMWIHNIGYRFEGGRTIIGLWKSFSTYEHKTSYKWFYSFEKSTQITKTIEDIVKFESSYKLQTFSSVYGVVDRDGEVYVVEKKWNNSFERFQFEFKTALSRKEFHIEDKIPLITKKNDRTLLEYKSIFPIWRETYSQDKRRYYDAVFLPAPNKYIEHGLPKVVEEIPSTHYLNMYEGMTVRPRRPDNWSDDSIYMDGNPSRKHIDACLRHLEDVVCAGRKKAFNYLIKWIARMFQFPQLKAETAIVLHSKEQGTGKSIFLNAIVDAFGSHGFTYSGESHKSFNGEMQFNLFTVYNEATYGGDHVGAGKLKAELTDDIRNIEAKFKTPVLCKNFSHIAISSNNDWVAPIEIDDRRFVVLDVSSKKVSDFEYFSNLAESFGVGDIEVHGKIVKGRFDEFLWYILDKVDVSGFNPRVLPAISSKSKTENKLQGHDVSHIRWFRECLYEGTFAFESTITLSMLSKNKSKLKMKNKDDDMNVSEQIAGGMLMQAADDVFEIGDEPTLLPIRLIFDEYIKWHDALKIGGQKISMKRFGMEFTKYLGGESSSGRFAGSNHRLREIQSLKDCRLTFERKLKSEIDWNDG